MRLCDDKLELTAIYSICEGDKKIQNSLLARVSPDYFYSDAPNEAIKRILTLVKSTGEIPSYEEILSDPTITEESRKRLRKAESKVVEERKFKRLLRNLQRYYQARKLYFLSENLNKQLTQDKVDVDMLLEATANELTKARVRTDTIQEIHHIGKSNNSSDIVKKLLAKTKPNLVPTGFKAFDQENGGIAYGSLVGLGGPAGGGKTATALQLAQNMAKFGREDVAYVPLEMDEVETMERVLSNLSGVKLSRIKQKKTSTKEDEQIVDAYKGFVKDLKKDNTRLTVFAPYEDMTIEEILLTLKPYGYRVIFIDYLTLLKGVEGDDQWQKLGQVGRYCKIWAKNNEAIVVLLAQVNDEGALRYSQALKEHANNLWTWKVDKETREQRVMKIQQIKARNQKLFDFDLGYDDELFRVFDADSAQARESTDTALATDDEYLKDVAEED